MSPSVPPDAPRLYLAGPEVFLTNALEIGAAKKAICARHGLTGCFPLDGDLDISGPPRDIARRIHDKCLGMMASCDGAIAHLTPLRGVGADVGTVFEVGFMAARGRPVWGYSHDIRDHRTRAVDLLAGCRNDQGVWRDGDGLEIEDFGLGENLMVAMGLPASGGGDLVTRAVAPSQRWTDLTAFASCVAAAARHWGRPPG